MPIYEYRCPNGHTFEIFQRMADAPIEACETCGAGPVEKILFPVAVHFKGSGFYSTDYGRGGRKRESEDSSSESKDSKESKESKESKTETASKSSDTSTKTDTGSKPSSTD